MIKEIVIHLAIALFLLFVIVPISLWLILWIGHYAEELLLFIFDLLPWPK